MYETDRKRHTAEPTCLECTRAALRRHGVCGCQGCPNRRKLQHPFRPGCVSDERVSERALLVPWFSVQPPLPLPRPPANADAMFNSLVSFAGLAGVAFRATLHCEALARWV